MGIEQINSCIILAGGPMGDYATIREKIDKLAGGKKYVICADGGADHANELLLTPDIIIGDLDSVSEIPQDTQVLCYPGEKNETDTILAIDYALSKGFTQVFIIGGLSSRLDHTVANFAALSYLYDRGGSGAIIDASNEVRMVIEGSIIIEKRSDYYISVFPFDGVCEGVSERGLKYSLDDAVLSPSFPIGVSNEFFEEKAEICVKKGRLLIILAKKRTK